MALEFVARLLIVQPLVAYSNSIILSPRLRNISLGDFSNPVFYPLIVFYTGVNILFLWPINIGEELQRLVWVWGRNSDLGFPKNQKLSPIRFIFLDNKFLLT